MTFFLIVAMSLNRVIVKDNQLPRHYPEDLKRFKVLTTHHTVLMGRKTFESIGKPLPQRKNIVLTHNPHWQQQGVVVYHDFDACLKQLQTYIVNDSSWTTDDEEIFIIWWEQIYKLFLPFADKIYLTLIKKNSEGDTFFPSFEHDFQEIKREIYDELDFIIYQKTTN